MTALRAHALLADSSFEETKDGMWLRGVATEITPTRHGHTVIPRGAIFELPFSLLWQHQQDKPLGQVREASVGDDRIRVGAFMPRPSESDALIARYAEAVESVKLGLVRGFSIGFSAKPGTVDIDQQNYTLTFREWLWYELSLVTIPEHTKATIHAVQHFAEFPAQARAPAPPPRPNLDNLPRLARRIPGVVYR